MTEKIRLTQTVNKGGCAAKVAAQELREIIKQVNFPETPDEILLDGRDFDDAAVLGLNPETGVVQTLDFFTPIVDDPYTFGQVAAANAMSDVYAMGGLPKTALAILAFPLATFERNTVSQILQGAIDTIRKGDTYLVGGHSIDDDTLKFGLSVTGLVNPKTMWTNAKARPDDVILLTKPLGTGTLCAGLKNGTYTEAEISDALQSMTTLNRVPAILTDTLKKAVHAATDITGFGLSGHAYQCALASHVSIEIETAKLPLFARTLESLQKENLTKAHRTNREYTQDFIVTPEEPLMKLVIHDPQTSGGLFLIVDPRKVEELTERIRSDFPHVTQVGRVTKRADRLVKFL